MVITPAHEEATLVQSPSVRTVRSAFRQQCKQAIAICVLQLETLISILYKIHTLKTQLKTSSNQDTTRGENAMLGEIRNHEQHESLFLTIWQMQQCSCSSRIVRYRIHPADQQRYQ